MSRATIVLMTISSMLLTEMICWGQADNKKAKRDPVYSGPQVGEKVPGLKILYAFSDDDKTIDVVEAAKGQPMLIVFFHKKTRPAFGLMNALLRYSTAKKDKLASAAVLLSDDSVQMRTWAKVVRKHFANGIQVGVSPEGIEGPGAYGLNRDVELTVLVSKQGKVAANFALVQPSLQVDGPVIAKAIASVIGEDGKDFAKFSRGMMRRPAANQRGGLDPELGTKLRAVISKNNSPEQTAAAAKELEQLIAENKVFQTQLGTVINRIIDAGVLERYGTKKAREYLQKWGKKYKHLVKANGETKRPAAEKDSRKSSQEKQPVSDVPRRSRTTP